ncbi:hypothetical protein DXT90_07910 [Agrobacterium tumefaciens]|nr:hypothetical protein [Agrobacterium tumefaciens]
MKLLSAAICLISVGILSGCVDDRGYRSSGYYATGVTYRSYDRDRYHRHYDRGRYYRNDDRRGWRNHDGWRGDRHSAPVRGAKPKLIKIIR